MAGDRAILNGGYPSAVTLGAPPNRVEVQGGRSSLKAGPRLGKPDSPPRDPADLLYGLKSSRAVQVDGLQDMTQAGVAEYKCAPEYTRSTSEYLSNRGTLKGVARTFDQLDADTHGASDGDQTADGLAFREKMI